jgi:hypothetical protein
VVVLEKQAPPLDSGPVAVAKLQVEVEDLKLSVTELGMTLATVHTAPAAPIQLLPTPTPPPPTAVRAPPRAQSVVVVSSTPAVPVPAASGTPLWRPARATRAPRPAPTPPHTSRCLFVANERGPDGNWYFGAGKIGWRATLTRQLGANAPLLTGVQMVTVAKDTRLCLACPDRQARGALLAKIRGLRSMRVYAQLGA